MRRPLLAPERIMVCTAATWLFLRPGVLAVPVDLESATSGADSTVQCFSVLSIFLYLIL